MENEGQQPTTHMTDFKGRIRTESSIPANPQVGEMFFYLPTNSLEYWTGNNWLSTPFND